LSRDPLRYKLKQHNLDTPISVSRKTNGHIWFSPIIPRTGEAVLEANRVFAKAAKDFGLPLLSFILPTTY